MMITADMKKWIPIIWVVSAPEPDLKFTTIVATAIPILNDEILTRTFIKNEDIILPICDIKGVTVF